MAVTATETKDKSVENVTKTKSKPYEVLAEIIKPSLTVDDGKVMVEGNPFIDNLPPTLNVEQVEALRQYQTNFALAATTASGPMLTELLKRDKELERASVSFDMTGRDKFEVTQKRSVEVRNPAKPDEAPQTRYGVTSAAFNFAGGTSGAAFKSIREDISSKAEVAFK